MPVMSISREEIVHFRVRDMFPNPMSMSPMDALILGISYVSQPGGVNYGTSAESLAPYLDALHGAIRSQAVYWIDLDYSKQRIPPPPNDSTLDRFLKAVRDEQVVDTGGDEDSG